MASREHKKHQKQKSPPFPNTFSVFFVFKNRKQFLKTLNKQALRLKDTRKTRIEWYTKDMQVKQSHTQDSIYVVRQFAYVHGVAGISLLSRKNTEYNLAATISLYIYNTATPLY